MKHPFLVTCAILLLGGAVAAMADNDAPSTGPDQNTAVKMGYRTLANGAVIYEEVPNSGVVETTNPENIAPAAGGDEPENSQAPQFKYDPLTQTYRRVVVDHQGNSAQDIINTNNR